jgi:HK97 family phage major capsid protein
MNLNDTLKAHAFSKLGVSSDADDEAITKAYSDALATGTITQDEIARMGKEDKKTTSAALKETVATAVSEAMAPVVESLAGIAKSLERPVEQKAKATNAAAMEALDCKTSPRVKDPIERYCQTKSRVHYPHTTLMGQAHPNAGQPLQLEGRAVDTLSDADMAVIGAVMRQRLAHGAGQSARISEHDRQLREYAAHKMTWCGEATDGGKEYQGELLDDMGRKAVLDDTTSGGSYVIPEVLDLNFITTPILSGELSPYVNMQTLPRGSSVQAPIYTDFSFAATAEGSAITLVSTSGLITQFTCTIFPVRAVIEMGRNWLSDTPINFGRWFTQRGGLKLMEWMDEQIAIGDGTTEPEGIFTTSSGITTVPSVNGTSGPFLLEDLRNMQTGLTKAFRSTAPKTSIRFVTLDVTYKYISLVQIGGSSDLRPLFVPVNTFGDYILDSYPVSINENITSAQIVFAHLGFYNMYRRQGLETQFTREGVTLMRSNTEAMSLTARYGGKIANAAAIVKMTTAPVTYEQP